MRGGEEGWMDWGGWVGFEGVGFEGGTGLWCWKGRGWVRVGGIMVSWDGMAWDGMMGDVWVWLFMAG